MVHQHPLASKQDQKPPIAKTATHSGKLVQSGAQIGIRRAVCCDTASMLDPH
jgi:hypothetical protein